MNKIISDKCEEVAELLKIMHTNADTEVQIDIIRILENSNELLAKITNY